MLHLVSRAYDLKLRLFTHYVTSGKVLEKADEPKAVYSIFKIDDIEAKIVSV